MGWVASSPPAKVSKGAVETTHHTMGDGGEATHQRPLSVRWPACLLSVSADVRSLDDVIAF